jgi:hypothetical protein
VSKGGGRHQLASVRSYDEACSELTADRPLQRGRARRHTLLFVHTYVSVPAPTAVVAIVKLTRIHRGHFGIHAVAEIPRIAGGAGSVTRFRLRIGRRFTYRGRRQSYLTGSCPTGRYYTEGKVRFEDDTWLGLAHVLPCTPSG